MSVPPLATRLRPPPLRADAVARPRLMQLLDEAVPAGIVAIAAPAGAGKTTLLAQWATETRRPVAWLGLEPGDEDGALLVTVLIDALRHGLEEPTLGEEARLRLEGRGTAAERVDRALTDLLNELSTRDVPWALVLDDHHHVEAPAARSVLARIAEGVRAPGAVVLGGRSDPALPLARLRLEGRLVMVRDPELRFTSSEATRLLSAVAGRAPTPEAVGALTARTEGWAAGLLAAALGLRGRTSPEEASRFVTGFTASHHLVFDYLGDEVLVRQPPEVLRFLRHTCVLRRLDAAICAAMLAVPSTGSVHGARTDDPLAPGDAALDGHAAAMLRRLEREQLFLQPLDDGRRWYRYHGLFADLLLRRLRRDDPALEPRLHRAAMMHLAARGEARAAVRHGLRAGEEQVVARLIEGEATAMALRGEGATLRRWLDALPEELVAARAGLCVARAWAALQTETEAAAERWLTCAEALVSPLPNDAAQQDHAAVSEAAAELDGAPAAATSDDAGPTDAAETSRVRGEIAALRADLLSLRGDVQGTLRLARQALKQLPDQGAEALRVAVSSALAGAYHMSGQVDRAAEAFERTVERAREGGRPALALGPMGVLAEVRRMQARLQDSEEVARQAVALGERLGARPAAGVGRALLSLVCVRREQGDLEGAQEHLTAARELGEQRGSLTLRTVVELQEAASLKARGDLTGALEAVARAEGLARDFGLPDAVMENFVISRLQLHLEEGRLDPVRAWARGRHEAEDVPPTGTALLARLWLLDDRPAEVERCLGPAVAEARTAGHRDRVLHLQLLRALAADALGRDTEAVEHVAEALALAAAGGYRHSLTSLGAVGRVADQRGLLRRAAAAGHQPSYVGLLLTDLDAPHPEARQGRSQGAHPPLVEPLSERELEVLRLVAAGLSNREVGRELGIALGTVKRHLTNVYGKLGAESRTHAVALARERDMLT